MAYIFCQLAVKLEYSTAVATSFIIHNLYRNSISGELYRRQHKNAEETNEQTSYQGIHLQVFPPDPGSGKELTAVNCGLLGL